VSTTYQQDSHARTLTHSASLARRGIAAMVVLFCLATIQAATANADPTYGVMNAEGGIYWRSGPDWNTPEAVPGNGFYPDTVIAVHCYQAGAGNVPGSTDYMWEQASVVAGSGYGSGWVNEHFINDGQPINQPSPGVPPCGSAPPGPPPSSPPPSAPPSEGGPTYSIVDADGGVYFRNSPRWSDPRAIPGAGVYTGDQVRLVCGAFGEAYGPYANRWWSYVQNLSRSDAGSGWVNAHFINDAMPANQPSPGETVCPTSIPGSPGASGGGVTTSSGPRSAFYWPQLGPDDWPRQPPFEAPADKNVAFSDWDTGGTCRPDSAHFNLPGTVNTLAGWSGSRIAPVYFLAANPSRWSQIHTIILFDPGSYDEMYDGGSGCDKRLSPSVNSILAKWLESSQNRLLVLTGQVSEEKHEFLGVRWGKAQFAGLWNFYFHDLWPKSADIRSRAIVCDYDYMGHDEVIEDFWQIVKAAAAGNGRDSCPLSLQAPDPIRWSP